MIIESLLYLMNFSILDIVYVVSRYSQCLSHDHCDVLSRLKKYLRGAIEYLTEYSGFLVVLKGW